MEENTDYRQMLDAVLRTDGVAHMIANALVSLANERITGMVSDPAGAQERHLHAAFERYRAGLK